MKDEQKQAIETKWKRLVAGAGKPRKAKSPAKPTGVIAGAKVIRRRKGSKDLPVC